MQDLAILPGLAIALPSRSSDRGYRQRLQRSLAVAWSARGSRSNAAPRRVMDGSIALSRCSSAFQPKNEAILSSFGTGDGSSGWPDWLPHIRTKHEYTHRMASGQPHVRPLLWWQPCCSAGNPPNELSVNEQTCLGRRKRNPYSPFAASINSTNCSISSRKVCDKATCAPILAKP